MEVMYPSKAAGSLKSIQYYNPEDKYASTVVVFRIVERSMSSDITEVNGTILSLKILFKAVLEMILQ
jgi:hypothetical protein